ncbi:MAG: reverse transcriptase family protein [Planctomycetaceae bacterium]
MKKVRWIEAPDAELKAAQRWLLDNWLYQLSPTGFAHGFVPGRSILTNAASHVGRRWVVTVDIRNFFPTITAPRVHACLAEFKLEESLRHTVVQLVTRRGRLPQGAPTSPHLANLVARTLDLRLAGLARSHGWTYTRYADDLTFSAGSTRSSDSGCDALPPRELLCIIDRIVVDEHFRLAPGKTHVMSHHQRQTVTGLVVNQRVSLPRPRRRVLRAMLHQLATADPAAVCLHQLQIAQGHLALARLIDSDGYARACRDLTGLIRQATHPVANCREVDSGTDVAATID